MLHGTRVRLNLIFMMSDPIGEMTLTPSLMRDGDMVKVMAGRAPGARSFHFQALVKRCGQAMCIM